MDRATRRQNRWDSPAIVHGQRPHTLAAIIDLNERAKLLHHLDLAGLSVDIKQGRDTVWLVIRVGPHSGGIAMRGVYSPDGDVDVGPITREGNNLSFTAHGNSMGKFRVEMRIVDAERALIRWSVWLTPAEPLLMPPQPWSIHPIDEKGSPLTTRGIVHAKQQATAAGVLYFTITEPAVGSVFYFQDLTALNDYCKYTRNGACTIVGENWPGLGFLPPPSDERALPAGREVSICDAYVRVTSHIPTDEKEVARLFLDELAAVYRHLPKPPTEYKDWPMMAEATLRDLQSASKIAVEEQGYLYLHPYVSAEYPDSMVQLAVLLPLMEYAKWSGQELPIIARLREPMRNFFDGKLRVVRRYLSTVGGDKDRDKVDSWYLYHPLANLGRLAVGGDDDARSMFLESLEYGIAVAHHFNYEWPVIYNMQTWNVDVGPRREGKLGQTDVPGIYAYVMHQAYELTKEQRYLDEARTALDSLSGLSFEIGYQFNNVAWGMAACLRMWKETGDSKYLRQAEVFLASFMHNTNIWECNYGPAEHYATFMGVTCLQDGNYMAAYEEFEAFMAFHECFDLAADVLNDSTRTLMAEFCRYALHRSWYYYPAELPRHILAGKIREGNGHIDSSLAIPLEDLYADWTAPGTVGQEVYGAGMAFALLVRSHHKIAGAPFTLFCDYPLRDLRPEDQSAADRGAASFRVHGTGDYTCRLLILPADGTELPHITVDTDRGPGAAVVEGAVRTDGAMEFTLHGGSEVTVRWSSTSSGDGRREKEGPHGNEPSGPDRKHGESKADKPARSSHSKGV